MLIHAAMGAGIAHFTGMANDNTSLLMAGVAGMYGMPYVMKIVGNVTSHTAVRTPTQL